MQDAAFAEAGAAARRTMGASENEVAAHMVGFAITAGDQWTRWRWRPCRCTEPCRAAGRYMDGGGIVLVSAVLATRPDIDPVIERVRPWIGDRWRTGEIAGALPEAG